MALTLGMRLGVYEVAAQIGEGGMGAVYRATDTTLGRLVAIKVLPDAFASDADRLARFDREAKTLAALNHPNIAQIYGLERSGGIQALVMELVDGDDLSQRIARRPIPLDEALPIAKQIADALEAAHELGIIHRDLKPANIKVRADGTVKVLDFGLAKALDPASVISGSVSMSPTITSPATAMGMIIGTAAYMSPEQARGKAVDRRADIWAFGAVLFEMLTGQRPFPGDDLSLTLAAVMTQDPAWAALPATTPSHVRQLLRRCLVKDPRQRIRDMGDVRLALESANEPAPTPSRHGRSPLVWALAAIAATSLAVAAFALWNRPTVVQGTTVRFTIPLPTGHEIMSSPAITRDGRTVAYVTQRASDPPQLYLRDLNSFEGRMVAGSSGATQPFFSPDGKWVAFFARGSLHKAEVTGGAPIRLVEAPLAFGATWNEDNTIIYSASLGSGLLRIPASGGTPEALTKPDGAAQGYAHVFPQALPGGRRILFTIWGQSGGGAVFSLDSGRWETVLPTSAFSSAPMFDPTEGAPGRLLVVDPSAGIRAAPFDAAHGARTSADTSVLENVYYDVESEIRGWLAVSNTGTAVYVPGNPGKKSLVWVDREGKTEALAKEQDVYQEVALSPDGARAVVRLGADLWVFDIARGTRSRLTSQGTRNIVPSWSSDGTRIIFASSRGGDWDIYSQAADGSGTADLLLKRAYDQFPGPSLADGTRLFREIQPKTAVGLWTLSPDGKISPLREPPSNHLDVSVSSGPPGAPRWIAYSSDESGNPEIYVQSYPAGANRMAVSQGGGGAPRWSRDSKELFYISWDAIMVVTSRPDGSFGAPRRLFDRSNLHLRALFQTYDVAADGKRFLMIRRDPGSVPQQLNVILNWSEETRKAPRLP